MKTRKNLIVGDEVTIVNGNIRIKTTVKAINEMTISTSGGLFRTTDGRVMSEDSKDKSHLEV